ncbi:MAG: AAA family ATPase [Candidatus Woesearchaeota archaeon]
MKVLILFAGLPGTGKSHIARILSKKIRSYYFDSDKFSKDFLKDNNIESLNADEVLRLRIESQKKKIKHILMLYEKHDIIMLDTCFDILEARKLYYNLQNNKNMSIRIIVLEVKCTVNTSKQRILCKEHEHDRMIGTSKSRWKTYLRMRKSWTPIMHKNHFVIDSDKDILPQISAFIEKFELS